MKKNTLYHRDDYHDEGDNHDDDDDDDADNNYDDEAESKEKCIGFADKADVINPSLPPWYL